MEKKLKMGMIGGGINSFMGSVHREAMAKSGVAELVCGAFSGNRANSYAAGKELGLPSNRVYGSYRDFFRHESQMPPEERIDFVCIVTPNGMHYPVAMSAIDAKFPILCEKPFTCVRDEAVNLVRRLRDSNVVYGLASVYPAYPALQQLREVFADGHTLGNIRKIVTTCALGWMAQRIENTGNRQAIWRTDTNRSGPAGCLCDLGSQCFSLTEWVTGISVREVCAELHTSVPGRILDDDCTILVRFANGMEGVFIASQISTGRNAGLTLEIIGDKASLYWRQDKADCFSVCNSQGGTQVVQMPSAAKHSCLEAFPAPHPFADSDYVDALANVYTSFARYLALPPKKRGAEPICFLRPEDGLRNVAFTDAVLRNADPAEEGGVQEKWTQVTVPEVPKF